MLVLSHQAIGFLDCQLKLEYQRMLVLSLQAIGFWDCQLKLEHERMLVWSLQAISRATPTSTSRTTIASQNQFHPSLALSKIA
jgi:hypothetical protein